jgi:protein TonB
MELKISKYDNEEECCRSYHVDGYSFGVCTYPPKDKPIYDDSMVFTIVRDDPTFPGGMEALTKYLAENISCPPDVRCEHLKVYVQFIVERDGTITDAHVLRDFCKGCGEEVLRVVNSMPRWIPGKQRGKPVRVRFNLPVLIDRKK